MTILLIFSFSLALIYGLLLLVYGYGWRSLPTFQPLPDSGSASEEVRVTVIVPARNESPYIIACLASILAQKHWRPGDEIIVVNDFSTDNTADLVLSLRDPRIRLIHLSDYVTKENRLNSFKKKSLEIAIQQSRGELILTTDADCVVGPCWVETLVQFYRATSSCFIAAPVAFHQEKNFFQAFQSLDFMTMQGVTGAMARLKTGTLCNGANLAYEKKAFFAVGGFQGIDSIASGDDMLLMYKMHQAYPGKVNFLKSWEAIVRTLPVERMGDFMQQRIRWSSKAGHYEDSRITLVLALVYAWNGMFLILLIWGFFHTLAWEIAAILLLYKTLVELTLLIPVARFFKKTSLLWQFFPGQFFHIPYILMAGWLGKMGSYQWKGRRVH
ncbi:MAG: glycosyltransferase [Chitinophagaceae bacterium]